MLNLKFTEEQRRALDALEWYIAETSTPLRGAGRTTVMALVVLRSAVRNAGTPQPLVDHVPGAVGMRALRDMVGRLLDHTQLAPYAQLHQDSLVIRQPSADEPKKLAEYVERAQAVLAL